MFVWEDKEKMEGHVCDRAENRPRDLGRLPMSFENRHTYDGDKVILGEGSAVRPTLKVHP